MGVNVSSTAPPSTTPPSTIQNSHHLPNTRSKWTDSELSKMRLRWWNAVRAKRKKCDDNQKQRRSKDKDTALLANRKEDEDGHCMQDDDDSSSGTNASSLSSSDEESNVRHSVYNDPTQPPSLNNTPFDEMDMYNNAIPAASPTSSPPVEHEVVRSESYSKEVPQSILELEHWCIQSSHPLHCAIYNHALNYYDHHGGAPLHNHCNHGNYSE